MKRIIMVASKSGGHIIPGLTVGATYHAEGAQVGWIGEERALDHSLIDPVPWLSKALFLSLTTINTRRWYSYPRYFLEFFQAFVRVWTFLSAFKPDMVISMGGYSSVPVCFAAWVRGIPYIVYELNAECGQAVKFLARRAKEIRCCFKKAAEELAAGGIHHTVIVRYPLRISAARAASREAAQSSLGVPVGKKVLLVCGGSQGSVRLNELVMRWVAARANMVRDDLYIIHQTGAGHDGQVQSWYKSHHIEALVFPFRSSLEECIAAADVVVTRAGAGMLFELQAHLCKVLVVPLEVSGNQHQVINAYAMKEQYLVAWDIVRQHDEDAFMRALDRLVAADAVRLDRQIEDAAVLR